MGTAAAADQAAVFPCAPSMWLHSVSWIALFLSAQCQDFFSVRCAYYHHSTDIIIRMEGGNHVCMYLSQELLHIEYKDSSTATREYSRKGNWSYSSTTID